MIRQNICIVYLSGRESGGADIMRCNFQVGQAFRVIRDSHLMPGRVVLELSEIHFITVKGGDTYILVNNISLIGQCRSAIVQLLKHNIL